MARGFTLLELLVAIAILAVLATLGFSGLSAVLQADRHVSAESRRWDDMATVLEQVSRDLSRAVARPVREVDGRERPALLLSSAPGGAPGQLELTRLGETGAGDAQAALQRVAYRLHEEQLEYLVWSAPDPAPGVTAQAHAVLERVRDLRMRALGEDNAWRTRWPVAGQKNPLPRAVEIQLTLAGGETITRIFVLQ
jgi:general secretion pathway protein J